MKYRKITLRHSCHWDHKKWLTMFDANQEYRHYQGFSWPKYKAMIGNQELTLDLLTEVAMCISNDYRCIVEIIIEYKNFESIRSVRNF